MMQQFVLLSNLKAYFLCSEDRLKIISSCCLFKKTLVFPSTRTPAQLPHRLHGHYNTATQLWDSFVCFKFIPKSNKINSRTYEMKRPADTGDICTVRRE